jgi:tetratricopeptide (TPR) repeat protein
VCAASCALLLLCTAAADADEPPPEPVPVIFDTDLGNDIDDALALGVLHALESRGASRLLAVTLSKGNPLAAPAVDAINHFYGRGQIPVGQSLDAPTPEEGTYLGSLVRPEDGEKLRFPRQIEPGEARYHSDLGSALLAAGDVEGAIGSYRRALAIDARSSVVTANLGYALSLANRHEEAVTTLRHAVELDPNNVTALDNLGTALARRGDRAGAVEAFTRAQAIEPNDPRARTGLEALDAGVTGAAH